MDQRSLLLSVLALAVATAGCTAPGLEPSTGPPYSCPEQKRIDCMPTVNGNAHPACSGNYSDWVQQNCNVSFTY
ncbi:MAG: hypothetical protein SV186_06025 [Candidatus Nanohaloarchaea archaeon]|nr:hypothetical protein [Candidatus Nanohaloarchaea archaeon]